MTNKVLLLIFAFGITGIFGYNKESQILDYWLNAFNKSIEDCKYCDSIYTGKNEYRIRNTLYYWKEKRAIVIHQELTYDKNRNKVAGYSEFSQKELYVIHAQVADVNPGIVFYEGLRTNVDSNSINKILFWADKENPDDSTNQIKIGNKIHTIGTVYQYNVNFLDNGHFLLDGNGMRSWEVKLPWNYNEPVDLSDPAEKKMGNSKRTLNR
jgi:hypothetical protein